MVHRLSDGRQTVTLCFAFTFVLKLNTNGNLSLIVNQYLSCNWLDGILTITFFNPYVLGFLQLELRFRDVDFYPGCWFTRPCILTPTAVSQHTPSKKQKSPSKRSILPRGHVAWLNTLFVDQNLCGHSGG